MTIHIAVNYLERYDLKTVDCRISLALLGQTYILV